MNSFCLKLRVTALLATIGFLAGAPQPVEAEDLNIATSPLFVATNVEPNLVFTLDDSGSMQWEHMPDSRLFGVSSFMFPRPSGVYGGEDQREWVPIPWGAAVFPENFYAFFSRSANNNSVYYDPTIEYGPWVNAAGVEMSAATPGNALYNPASPERGSLNLLQQQSGDAVWFAATAPPGIACQNPQLGCTSFDVDYWPITFFQFDGTGDPQLAENYVRYQIRDGLAFALDLGTGIESPVASFSWTDGETTIVRTVADEIQNFANWFQYHRSRILTARAGIGRAFVRMPDEVRVGFASINSDAATIDNVSSPQAMIRGVRSFGDGSDPLDGRSEFYDTLYQTVIEGITPLRSAADAVGQYFERSDSRGPWSTTPGVAGGEDLSCRQSFHVLMTDGFWNGPNPNLGNVDGTSGPSHTGPDLGAGTRTFTYTAESPFDDDFLNTLGDVGMHYWKRDLRPDLPNRISTTSRDPAFWQHLTAFGIGLGVEGNIDADLAFEAITSGEQIDWPNPGQTAPDGNGNLQVENRENSGAAIDDLLHFAVNGRGGFFSAAAPETFAKELGDLLVEIVARTAAVTGVSASSTRLDSGSLAFLSEFDSDGWTGEIRAVAVEDGREIWDAADNVTAAGNVGRRVLTSRASGNGGMPFDTTMNAAMKKAIALDPAQANRIINYVRGAPVNGFRERTSLLGDIVNSRPTFAGPGNEGWSRLPVGGSSYPAFVDSKESLGSAVYVGANDGMLHAFDAGSGSEQFAFVPRAVFPKLVELTKDPYDHQFFVDGQQVVRDAFSGSWKRVLVGTLGAGGRGAYAIDVTRPSSPEVLWEITGEDDPDMGFAFGEPIITRLGNGQWVALVGNGYNSDDNNAVLFVIDLFGGSFRKVMLETSSDSNGLAGVAPLLDPVTRMFTRRAYAGDLNGTMWRVDFDVSGSPSIKFTKGLFSEPAGRPITTAPGLAASPSGGVFVYFGTGKLIEPEDRFTTNTRMEKLYAIRDRESALGNNARLGLPSINEAGGLREIIGAAGDDGWVLQLSPNNSPTGERSLARPLVAFGRVLFTTFEPEDDPCSPGGIQRLYVVNALSGEGELDNICENCGVVTIGVGAPIVPPLVISDPKVDGPGNTDPGNPFRPPEEGDSLPGLESVGAISGWCEVLSTLNPETGGEIPIGPICRGRQVWRQAR